MGKKLRTLLLSINILTATIILIGVSCSGNNKQESTTPTEVIVTDTIK